MSEIWYFNASPKALGTQGTSYSVNFKAGGESFTILRNGTVLKEKFYLYYNDTMAYKSGWTNTAYRTVEFEEPVTGDLLTYMTANATKVEAPAYSFKGIMRGTERIGTGTYKFAPYVDYVPSTDFTVAVNAINMSYSPSPVPNMTTSGTQEITFTANTGYKAPEQSGITVTNASIVSFTRSSDTVCKVTLGNATGNVTITAVATRIPTYSVTFNLTNISYPSSVYIKEDERVSVTLTASEGYLMPSSGTAFTVTNASKLYSPSADMKSATLVLLDATGNVTVTGSAVQSASVSGIYKLKSTMDLSNHIADNMNFISNAISFSGIWTDGGTLYYDSNIETTTYETYCADTGWVDNNYRVLDFGDSAQTVSADFASFLNTNSTTEDISMIQISYVGKSIDTSSLPYDTSYTIRSSAPTVVSVQDDGGAWVAEALAEGDAIITVIETTPDGDAVKGTVTVAVAPALTGTALAKDVRVSKTFYNTDPSIKETGTIPTYGSAYLPILSAPKNLSIDILTLTFSAVSGATSYNIYANNTLLGNSTSTSVMLAGLKNYSSLANGTYNISVEATGAGFANSKRSSSVSFTKSAGYKVTLEFDVNASDNNVEFTIIYSNGSTRQIANNGQDVPNSGPVSNVIAIITSDYLEITENDITKSIQGAYMLISDVTIKRTLFAACIDAETLVIMADNTTKKLGDIEVGDEVLSIDYNTMSLVSRKVIYSGRDEPGYDHWYVNSYWENVYSDGTIIKQAMKHRFYNLENQSYVHLDYWNIGEHTYKIDGTNPYLVSRTLKQGRLNYARITLEDSNNYFANNLSTGDSNCCPNPVVLNGALKVSKKEG